MLQITYTEINDPIEIATTLNTTGHSTGHVYLIYKNKDESYNIILGHNEKYDNLASFGGFSEEGETLLQTICREFDEEALGCIFSEETLISLLQNHSVMITRKSVKGQHYTVFCNATGLEFDESKINGDFLIRRQNPELTVCQKENDYIVVVSLAEIEQNLMIDNKDVVMDSNGKVQRIRDINIPAYKWFFDYLKRDPQNILK